MKNDIQTIRKFVRELSRNNNREWFMAHKDEYLDAKSRFDAITEKLIAGISQFDPSCQNLTVKDCTYRIYRDVRFSKDKSPYKTHFGAYVCPGGKKSGYAGYYFHIGTGEGEGYPASHMLAVGDYRYNPEALRILKEDILDGDFDKIIKEEVDSRFIFDDEQMYAKVPKGFPADSPYEYYLRLKTFCLCYNPDNDFMLSDDAIEKAIRLFRTTYSFTQFVNRAIRYSKEEL